MQSKHTLLFSLVFLFTITTEAQIKKGMSMVGATIGSAFLNSGKSDYSFPSPTTGFTSNSNASGFILNPSMGWFVSDNTVVGALLNLSYNYRKNFDEANGITFNRDITKTFNIGLGAFARNYFNSTGNLKPYGQFSFNFGIGSSTQEGFRYVTSTSPVYKDTYDGKSSGDFYANAGLAIGATKMLNANVGLDFFAAYNYSYNKHTFKTTTRRDLDNNGSIDQTLLNEPTLKFTSHGASIGAGFQVFLDKRK